MADLPKFIRIKLEAGVVFINVNNIDILQVDKDKQSISFWFEGTYRSFTGENFLPALDAWLEYWKVSP